MDDNEKGLYNKYAVFKTGDPTPVYSAFVLKPETDPVARKALRLYASLTKNEHLKRDLKRWLAIIDTDSTEKKDDENRLICIIYRKRSKKRPRRSRRFEKGE